MIISADELKIKAKELQKQLVEKELSNINDTILNAAEKGYSYIRYIPTSTLSTELLKTISKELKNAGYIAFPSLDYENTIFISW